MAAKKKTSKASPPRDNSQRAHRLRMQRLVALIDEAKAREYLRQIEEVSKILAKDWRRMDSEQVAALRLRVDINFKRLAKVFPDLKSVDLTLMDPEGDNPLNSLSDVLREALREK